MIQANQPRFLRSGDKIFLSAKLLNLTNQPQKVEASLSVYDLVTQKRIDQKSSAIKADIGADGQQEVFWEVEVPDQVQRVRLTYSVVGGIMMMQNSMTYQCFLARSI